MQLFGIPDFIAGWRQTSFGIKQVTIYALLAFSYFIGFSAGCGKALALDHLNGAVALGYGLLWGAASAASLATLAIGLPVALPQFLLDWIAQTQVQNSQNAPAAKKDGK